MQPPCCSETLVGFQQSAWRYASVDRNCCNRKFSRIVLHNCTATTIVLQNILLHCIVLGPCHTRAGQATVLRRLTVVPSTDTDTFDWLETTSMARDLDWLSCSLRLFRLLLPSMSSPSPPENVGCFSSEVQIWDGWQADQCLFKPSSQLHVFYIYVLN
jgi:hypothetical protein